MIAERKRIYLGIILGVIIFSGCVNNKQTTLDDFGIRANSLFLYYSDLEGAASFYSITLGMEVVADYEMALILRMTADSYLILVDAARGMHSADEPKTVALALLTDQLDEWYNYLVTQDVEIKYDYKPKEGSPHDGFVIIDPEGYLLEFERFNPHSENENFIPLLERNIEVGIESSLADSLPPGLKIHSSIIWLYYDDILAMQDFYMGDFGFPMVADQGWTKIHQVSGTGFIGLVDGSRGMHKPTDKKAVNVGFIIDDLQDWMDYVKEKKLFELREQELGDGPESKYKAFVGYDPGGYYLEFDRFYSHPDNDLLMKYLEMGK